MHLSVRQMRVLLTLILFRCLVSWSCISPCLIMSNVHDDVIKWKHFPRYWPFVRGIHRPPVNSPHKGQWRGALVFSFICVWINRWVNNREAGDLRRYRAHTYIYIHIYAPALSIALSNRLISGEGNKGWRYLCWLNEALWDNREKRHDSLCKNSFVITMEQIDNWNILMFISIAHSHIDGLVTTKPELPKHCQQHAMIF